MDRDRWLMNTKTPAIPLGFLMEARGIEPQPLADGAPPPTRDARNIGPTRAPWKGPPCVHSPPAHGKALVGHTPGRQPGSRAAPWCVLVGGSATNRLKASAPAGLEAPALPAPLPRPGDDPEGCARSSTG